MFRLFRPCVFILVLAGWLLLPGAGTTHAAPVVPITRDAQPALELTLAPTASPRVKQAAAQLAEMLARISGAKLSTRTGDGATGLVVGTPESFAALPFVVEFPAGPARPETYLLRSTERSLYVLGATDLAVEHAVWDLLHRLGYRHYFPGERWQIIPSNRNLSLGIDTLQKPDYLLRRLFYGSGDYMRTGKQRYEQWCLHNRMSSDDQRASVAMTFGHSYAGIAAANEQVFKEHPEYLALVGGQRKRNIVSQKFCTSNPGLQQLFADDAVAFFTRKPDAMSISRDPSDLGNWCQCESCAALGGASNQAVLLANISAEAVAKKFGPRYVTLQAYAFHSPPPTIQVNPYVVASVATSLTRGGLTVQEIMAGWAARGATIGVREYYSVFAWQHDLPSGARGMKPSYLAQSIPDFHARGARYMTAEACDNWGPNGVGYYLASRALWDVREGANWQKTFDEFLDLSFGPAREPMGRFYGLILDKSSVRISDDLLARQYRCLQEAWSLAANRADVRSRLSDLVMYVRYIELFRAYQQSDRSELDDGSEVKTTERQAAFEALLRHAWRLSDSGMVDAVAAWRDLERRERVAKIPPEAAFAKPDGKNPWKDRTPATETEIAQIIAEGVKKFEPFDFEPVSFSDDLLPARELGAGAAKIFEKVRGTPLGGATEVGSGQRGRVTYFVWLDESRSLTLQVATGLLYKDRGKLKLQLFDPDDDDTPVSEDASTPPDGQLHAVTLKSPRAGLHRLVVDNGNDRSRIVWPEKIVMSTVSPQSIGRWGLFFYVPRGTREVIGYTRFRDGTLIGPEGKQVLDFASLKPPCFFRVPVPAGSDGQLWKFHFMFGQPELLNVPPYLGVNLEQMLLPREVVEKDRKSPANSPAR